MGQLGDKHYWIDVMQSRPSVFTDSCFGFQAAIWHCLNHYAYPDAIFLAERLYAEGKFDDIYAIVLLLVAAKWQ
jgi:hypothetical protein